MALHRRAFTYLLCASLLVSSGCYRHTLRPEVIRERERLSTMTCTSGPNQTVVAHADTFYFYARCRQDPRERCEWLIAAADCGHRQAEQELHEIPNCYLNARNRRLDFHEEEVVTVLADYNTRAQECGYTTKKTTIGYILWPIGVVVAIPVLLITWPVMCLAHMKCEAPWNGL